MTYRCLFNFLPARLNIPTFEVVGSITSPANERSPLHRQPLALRLLSVDMLMYAFYIVYASIPLLLRLYAYSGDLDIALALFFPFPGVILTAVACIAKMTVPLRYMLWPPTVPEWNELVEEDESGVKRCRKDWDCEGPGNGVGWLGFYVCELFVLWRWCFY